MFDLNQLLKQVFLLAAILLGGSPLVRAQQVREVNGSYKVGGGKITATTVGVFDTVATYVEGRVVDIKNQKPIAGASVEVKYQSANRPGVQTRTVTTDKAGVFRLGWVGSRPERPLLVRAPSYQPLQTSSVRYAGDVDLKIELAATAPKKKARK